MQAVVSALQHWRVPEISSRLAGTEAILGRGTVVGKVKWGGWWQSGGGLARGEGWSLDAAVRLHPDAYPQASWSQTGPQGVLILLYSGYRSR